MGYLDCPFCGRQSSGIGKCSGCSAECVPSNAGYGLWHIDKYPTVVRVFDLYSYIISRQFERFKEKNAVFPGESEERGWRFLIKQVLKQHGIIILNYLYI